MPRDSQQEALNSVCRVLEADSQNPDIFLPEQREEVSWDSLSSACQPVFLEIYRTQEIYLGAPVNQERGLGGGFRGQTVGLQPGRAWLKSGTLSIAVGSQ